MIVYIWFNHTTEVSSVHSSVCTFSAYGYRFWFVKINSDSCPYYFHDKVSGVCVCDSLSLCRLLDVHSSEGRYEGELIFYMVFEYMEQDLDHFIRQYPAPGMEESIVKVDF